MARHFVQLDVDGETVKAELYSDSVPGVGPDIPADFVEVQDDESYLGIKKREAGAWVDLPVTPP